MPPDAPTDPWLSLLNDLDRGLDCVTGLHCIGGFAVVQAYGLDRATADIDVISVVPRASSGRLIELAGKESSLRRKHSIYIDVVTVASVTEDYEDRLVALYPGCWEKLRLFVLEPHDLALTKLERNIGRDRADVQHLARSGYINAPTLRQRYLREMRHHVIGRFAENQQPGPVAMQPPLLN